MKKILILILCLCTTFFTIGCADTSDSYYENISEYSEDESCDYTMRCVDSSCFSEIGYDSGSETLAVKFLNSGELYEYYGVSSDEYKSFMSSSSLGGYYNDHIKGQYECVHIE